MERNLQSQIIKGKYEPKLEFPKQLEGYHVFKPHSPPWESEYFVKQFIWKQEESINNPQLKTQSSIGLYQYLHVSPPLPSENQCHAFINVKMISFIL